MFVLLRHAHAIAQQSWHGPDAHRPLSALGQKQAAGLVATLTGIELRVLYCSPTTRCLDTLGPLAAAHDLPIHEHPLLAPDAAADELCAALDTGTWPAPCGAPTAKPSPRSPHAPAPTAPAHSPSGTPQRVEPGCSMPTPRRATSTPIRRSSLSPQVTHATRNAKGVPEVLPLADRWPDLQALDAPYSHEEAGSDRRARECSGSTAQRPGLAPAIRGTLKPGTANTRTPGRSAPRMG